MRPGESPEMPAVSPGSCLTQVILITAPFVGALIGKAIHPDHGMWWGIIAGIWVMGIGLHLVHRRMSGRISRCAGCGRGLALLSHRDGGALIMRTQTMTDPRQGVGVSCDRCRKTYCPSCRPQGACACGGLLRPVHLKYT